MDRPVTATLRPYRAAGGEGGDDDPVLAALEQGVEGVAHAALASGVARALHVGGVGQQSQHPLLPQCAESGQVDHPALDGGGVDLEVAGVDDGAHRALDGEGHRVGDGVVHMDELNGELARLDHVPRLAGDHLGLGHQVVLLQLQLDQARAHAGGVNGGVDGPQHIGDGSDVVLVAVGDKDAPDLALVLDEVAHIPRRCRTYRHPGTPFRSPRPRCRSRTRRRSGFSRFHSDRPAI